MSRTPNSRKDETHDRILAAAARSIRTRGYAGVGVADVMKEAGLTHGGFYAHFESRDVLLADATVRAGAESLQRLARSGERGSKEGRSPFRCLVDTYLADANLKSLEAGCPVAAVASEMPRQPQVVRDASASRVRHLIAHVKATLPQASEGAAAAVVSTLVGALQLARALGHNEEGRSILAAARASLIDQYDLPGTSFH